MSGGEAPLLVPRPRVVALLGGMVDDPGEAVERRVSGIVEGGYRLVVDGGVVIEAASDAGSRHGRATLTQLRRQYGARLPRLRVEDAPAGFRRGVMLDVSRDRVPTNDFLHALTDELALLKFDHLQLYTEHTFAYAGHEAVWREASPLTAEDVRALDARCAAGGIELAANQNCFGHMERWLRHPAYAALAETHDEYDFYGVRRRGPFSLCPTDPGSLALVSDLLDQLMPCFASDLVNIGCDETADVGQGRSRAAVASRGAFEVYARYLADVAALAVERGGRPMFWADVVMRHPERVAELPRSLTPLLWGYEPDAPFVEGLSRLASAGFRGWACPGTSSWRSVTGRTAERDANIAAAVEAAVRCDAAGVLLTEWGDLGHRQQPVVMRHGLARGAARMWRGEAHATEDAAISLQVFGDETLRVAGWLNALGDVDRSIRASSGLRNASALFEDMHPSGGATRLPEDEAPWRDVAERLEGLRGARPRLRLRDQRTDAEIGWTLDVAEFAALRASARRGSRDARLEADLAARLEAIIEGQRRLWSMASRPGGLGRSLAWWAGLLSE